MKKYCFKIADAEYTCEIKCYECKLREKMKTQKAGRLHHKTRFFLQWVRFYLLHILEAVKADIWAYKVGLHQTWKERIDMCKWVTWNDYKKNHSYMYLLGRQLYLIKYDDIHDTIQRLELPVNEEKMKTQKETLIYVAIVILIFTAIYFIVKFADLIDSLL